MTECPHGNIWIEHDHFECECGKRWPKNPSRRPSPSISEGEVEAVYDKGRELGAAALEEIGKMLIDAAAEVRSDNPFDLSKARATTEVEVKALQWSDMTGSGSRFRSHDGLLSYTISRITQDGVDYFRWARSQGSWSDVSYNAEDCKAAAQLDFATRIRSALVGGE